MQYEPGIPVQTDLFKEWTIRRLQIEFIWLTMQIYCKVTVFIFICFINIFDKNFNPSGWEIVEHFVVIKLDTLHKL